jgi:phospholipid/cholesterol/gamma-HCH transport system substrate-binding protein
MATQLGQSMQQMAATSRSVRSAAQDLAQLIEGVNAGEGNLGYLVRDTSLKGQMSQLSSQLDTLVGLRANSVLDSLEMLSSSLAEASRTVQSLVEDLDEGEGLVATLLTDSTFTYELQATLQNLEQGTEKFDQNMKALQYSWPFRKFFRKETRKRN